MTDIDVNMVLRPYDYLFPFFMGDAPTPGYRLKIDRHAALTLTLTENIDVAEVSFNRFLVGKTRGDNSIVGLPIFVLRGYRHRNFFVRADSKLHRLSDLKGKRLGTNSWPDTGTMWARAAMRDAGVGIEDVNWVIGTLDAKTPNKLPSPNDAQPPKNARFLAGSENLLDELRSGAIDAVTTAFAPEEVFQGGGWIRRLVVNYREAETEYHRRTGIYPGFHILAARRPFAEKHPGAILAIYKAMKQSYEIWMSKTKKFAEASPWAMEEIETLYRDFPDDASPFGTKSPSHRKMLEAVCAEQYAQGLVTRPADAAALFAEFDKMADAAI